MSCIIITLGNLLVLSHISIIFKDVLCYTMGTYSLVIYWQAQVIFGVGGGIEPIIVSVVVVLLLLLLQ